MSILDKHRQDESDHTPEHGLFLILSLLIELKLENKHSMKL